MTQYDIFSKLRMISLLFWVSPVLRFAFTIDAHQHCSEGEAILSQILHPMLSFQTQKLGCVQLSFVCLSFALQVRPVLVLCPGLLSRCLGSLFQVRAPRLPVVFFQAAVPLAVQTCPPCVIKRRYLPLYPSSCAEGLALLGPRALSWSNLVPCKHLYWNFQTVPVWVGQERETCVSVHSFSCCGTFYLV